MVENEIKPSFTWKYVVFMLVTSAIVGVVAFAVDHFLKTKPLRELEVYESTLNDLINDEYLKNAKIEATYFITGNPKKKIASLFRKTITIKNTGNEGVEDLSIVFSIKEENAFLVGNPKIISSPKEIADALNLVKDDNLSSEKKHTWNIPLLNQRESLTFEYNIYSENKLETLTFSSVPRKKDWKVLYIDTLIGKEKSDVFPYFITGMLTLLVSLLVTLKLFLKLMIPVYRKEWNSNPDVREKYESFNKYFYKHFPPPIKEYFRTK